ncbi:hypothetical protein Taro_037878 [Colocasia esculenta]|uniref:Uncharacterized protein n=1 Tax=Colocasia esculenta TaxID=4460 RepID=A0A843W1T8_COLES|nr:hypothetical protein [Colocasia esculenta]
MPGHHCHPPTSHLLLDLFHNTPPPSRYRDLLECPAPTMDALLSSFLSTTSSLVVPHHYHLHQATKLHPRSFRHHISAVLTDHLSTTAPPPPPPTQVDQSNPSLVQSSHSKTAPNSTIVTKGPTPRAAPPPSVPSLLASLCNALEDIINFIDPAAHRPSVDPRHVLTGNFAPVGELPPTPCTIAFGLIPCALAGGAFLHNGPNPQHFPRGPHHLFDGFSLKSSPVDLWLNVVTLGSTRGRRPIPERMLDQSDLQSSMYYGKWSSEAGALLAPYIGTRFSENSSLDRATFVSHVSSP